MVRLNAHVKCNSAGHHYEYRFEFTDTTGFCGLAGFECCQPCVLSISIHFFTGHPVHVITIIIRVHMRIIVDVSRVCAVVEVETG